MPGIVCTLSPFIPWCWNFTTDENWNSERWPELPKDIYGWSVEKPRFEPRCKWAKLHSAEPTVNEEQMEQGRGWERAHMYLSTYILMRKQNRISKGSEIVQATVTQFREKLQDSLRETSRTFNESPPFSFTLHLITTQSLENFAKLSTPPPPPSTYPFIVRLQSLFQK